MAESKREVHTTHDAHRASRLRAADEHRRVRRVRALLANLDHGEDIPRESRSETRTREGAPSRTTAF